MARKAWKELSPSYQKRLLKAGIDQKAHAAGRSIQAARGHRATPEHNIWRKRAIAADITASLPDFGKLPAHEAEELGRKWILGFMSKSAGPLQPVKMTDWRYGSKDAPDRVRYQTDAQINARLEFLAWVQNHPEAVPDGEIDWKRYRADYMATFSKKS